MSLKNETIAFYISDHGFGHASRNIPIIRYILEVYKDISIIIKTGENQGKFIEELLQGHSKRVKYYFSTMDIGLILKKDSLDIDKDKLEQKIITYTEGFDHRIKKEAVFLKENNVGLVIGDIVPWIFKSCKECNIPSILITNFTWVDIYKEHIPEYLVEKYTECYKLVDKALFYELYMEEMEQYINCFEKVSLCSREFDLEQVDKIKKKFKRKIVFVSVGRSVEINNGLSVDNLPYDFIVTEGIKLIGKNVHYLPKETTNTHEYIKASDYIITKAGWGTISEVLLANKKCAVLSRDNVAEDRNTIKKLKYINKAVEIKLNEGLDIKEVIEKIEKLNENMDIELSNDYKLIGEKIVGILRRNIYE